MTREQLLSEIDAFLATAGVKITESTFGRLAVNDGKLVPRLRSGGGLTLETAEKIQAFIRGYRPHTATLAEVPPPPPTEGAAV